MYCLNLYGKFYLFIKMIIPLFPVSKIKPSRNWERYNSDTRDKKAISMSLSTFIRIFSSFLLGMRCHKIFKMYGGEEGFHNKNNCIFSNRLIVIISIQSVLETCTVYFNNYIFWEQRIPPSTSHCLFYLNHIILCWLG